MVFILEPVEFQPAIYISIYDYKIHKYNKITIYIQLAFANNQNQYVHRNRRLQRQHLRTLSVQQLRFSRLDST